MQSRRMGTLKESPATEGTLKESPATEGTLKESPATEVHPAAWPPLPKGGNLHPSTACNPALSIALPAARSLGEQRSTAYITSSAH